MNEDREYEVAVVGGGIAGYTAALALKRFGRETLWLGTQLFGEKLARAEQVKNFPAFTGSGEELKALLERQMSEEGLLFTEAKIDAVYAGGGGFLLTEGKRYFRARTVVLATGTETAAAKGASRFLGKGVSYCAVCDGALYRNKTVVCEVSSERYAEEAEYLAGFAQKVYALCGYGGATFRAGNIEARRGLVAAVTGEERVTGVVTSDGERLGADGVFFLKDSAPPAVLVGGLATEDGHVKVARDMSTNLAGLFAAGDVTGRPYQYVKAAGEGLVAAFSVRDFLVRAEKNADR